MRESERRAKRREKITNFFHMTVVYFAGVVGVFLSKYIESYRAGETIVFDLEWTELVMALGVAGLVLYWMDRKGELSGKKRNWKRRILTSLALGVFWHMIADVVIEVLKK
jgi:predicted MFS family arabinose efflux permease